MKLRATKHPNRFIHPPNIVETDDGPVKVCLVEQTDRFGISFDGDPEPINRERKAATFEVEGLVTFPPLDETLAECFRQVGVPRLGGQSTGSGWSSVSLFQRCPYAWKRRYIDDAPPEIAIEPPARSIGSLIHTFVAVYYTRMREPNYPLKPEDINTFLVGKVQPEYLSEAWRVFVAYTLYFQLENIMPLAIEYEIRDPRNNDSCRLDMISFFPDDAPGRPAGTWIVEHKSAGRFDLAAKSWANDGEVIGQVRLWERMGLSKRFGPLQGAMVNILGKQKDPLFHRTYVGLASWLTKQHGHDLRIWNGRIGLAKATGVFERARGNCIGRWGLCDHYDHCATSEDA